MPEQGTQDLRKVRLFLPKMLGIVYYALVA